MSNAAEAKAFAAGEEQHELHVTQSGSAVTVVSPTLNGTGPWLARRVDDRRMLLVERDADTGVRAPDGMAGLPVEAFKDFLQGLAGAGWSGMVAVDTGAGLKRVYLNGGAVVFAASNL